MLAMEMSKLLFDQCLLGEQHAAMGLGIAGMPAAVFKPDIIRFMSRTHRARTPSVEASWDLKLMSPSMPATASMLWRGRRALLLAWQAWPMTMTWKKRSSRQCALHLSQAVLGPPLIGMGGFQ